MSELFNFFVDSVCCLILFGPFGKAIARTYTSNI